MTTTKTPAGVAARDEILRRLEQRAPLTASYKVTLDQSTVEALVEARGRLMNARKALWQAETDEDRTRLETQTAEAKAAEREAQVAVDDTSVTLKFEGLPDRTFRSLLDEHPPTDKQIEQAKAQAEAEDQVVDYNIDTFRPALIAATCVDPGFDSVEQVDDLLFGPKSRFTAAEAARIFRVALDTCRSHREVTDWGKESGETAG